MLLLFLHIPSHSIEISKDLKLLDLSKVNGSVKINSLIINVENWKGIYLDNVPITIEAIPNEGYVFVKWKNRKLPRKSKLEVLPRHQKRFIPVFEKSKLLLTADE